MNDARERSDQPGGLILGRDNDLQAVQRFVGDAGLGRCLVIAGDPGIGKTTLWEEAVQRGRSHGYTVVLARASQAEAALLFAAMADLLDGVSLGVLSKVPGPQRLALEVALRRAEPVHGAQASQANCGYRASRGEACVARGEVRVAGAVRRLRLRW